MPGHGGHPVKKEQKVIEEGRPGPGGGGEEQWCCREELGREDAVAAGTCGEGAASLPAPTRERAVCSQSHCPCASCHAKGFPFQHTLILWLSVLQGSSDDSPKVTYLASAEFPCQPPT